VAALLVQGPGSVFKGFLAGGKLGCQTVPRDPQVSQAPPEGIHVVLEAFQSLDGVGLETVGKIAVLVKLGVKQGFLLRKGLFKLWLHLLIHETVGCFNVHSAGIDLAAGLTGEVFIDKNQHFQSLYQRYWGSRETAIEPKRVCE
jgi:hypothetical protein